MDLLNAPALTMMRLLVQSLSLLPFTLSSPWSSLVLGSSVGLMSRMCFSMTHSIRLFTISSHLNLLIPITRPNHVFYLHKSLWKEDYQWFVTYLGEIRPSTWCCLSHFTVEDQNVYICLSEKLDKYFAHKGCRHTNTM
jgi:hypothetical protein